MQTASTLRDQNTLRQQLPVLTRHEGVWDGVYQYFNAEGSKNREHRSCLICRLPDNGPYPYHQTNHYFHPDGSREVREFPARFENGRLRWDNELIDGWAADVDLDEFNRTTMLYWIRKDTPDAYLYEMIHLSDCGQHRARVWQRFNDGRLIERTLINEQKVSDDWSAYKTD